MKQLKRTVLILLLAMGLTLGTLPALTQTAYAESAKVSYVSRSWSGGESGSVTEETKTQSCKVLEGSNAGSYTLTGGWFTVSKNVTYKGHMTVSNDTKIVLCDGATMNVNNGIYIKDGCTLTIYGQQGDSGKLVVKINDSYPGIGGENKTKGGNLTIHGGNVSAKGANNAAGIGGGDGESSGMGNVTIFGGSVTATGGSSGAGIGKGQHNNNFGTVTIYGGTVNASSTKYGAGIGGGEDRGSVATKIYGGTVTAKGGQDGAGIGGGEGGSGTDAAIEIYGGTVNASSTQYGAGIGGGEKGNGGTVTIKGGNVTATGGENGAGIGGCKSGNGGTVNIYGGTVTANGGAYASGIGGSQTSTGGYSSGGTVNIYGGSVTASGRRCPCIGGGDSATINIEGGTVAAENTELEAPAIGVMNEDAVLYFTMKGGNVTAKVNNGSTHPSSGGGAGLGGRYSENVEIHVNISGGTLTAEGGAGCTGIGSGSSYSIASIETGGNLTSKSEINISGNANVTATGGVSGGAGIGSGKGGNQQGTITISGGEVTATGNGGGAGIGGGKEGDWNTGGNAGTINITGGTITANAAGEGNAQAIGHGANDENEGTLTLGNSMCVKYGSNTAGKDDRVSKCREHGKRIVDVCEHSSKTYTSTEDTHTQTCKYCKSSFSAEAHVMDDNNKCRVCGYQGRLNTVSFEANGGSGSMSSVTIVPGKTYTLPAPEFTAPEGKAFEAWTVKVGSEDKGDLLPGKTITVTANTTATAKWSDQCIIRFDKGDEGASGSMEDVHVKVGSEYTLPECGFTAPDGTIFDKWSVKYIDDTEDKAEDKQPGDKVVASDHMTVTAVWADACTVAINAGEGASGDSITGKVKTGSSFSLPTYGDCGFTAPDGYAFDKWSVKIGTGEAQDMAPKAVITVSANTDVTAKWKKHIHSFTYTSDGVMITATCSNDDGACPLENARVSLTINKPDRDTYGGAGSAAATLSGLAEFKEATGLNVAETDIRYAGRDGTTYDESADAPTDAGKYTATITAKEKTASAAYSIAKAEPEYAVKPTIIEGLVYNNEEKYLINKGTTNDGEILYAKIYVKDLDELINTTGPEDKDYSPAAPTGKEPGYYFIWYYIKGDNNHNDSTRACLLNVIIVPDPSGVDKSELPSAVEGLRYDGREHELMDPPEKNVLSDGVYFAYYHQKDSDQLPGDAEFFEDIPTETDAGDYYVWFTIGGDPNGIVFPKMGPFSVTIDKADARTLDDVTVDQPSNIAEVKASVAGLMPDDADVQSYRTGDVSKPDNVTVSGFTVDENGNVTAEITGGKADDTVTLPVTISSTNYLDSTVNIFVDIGAAVHKVTVNNGSGSGTYAEGSTVRIVANAPAAGTKFAGWTGADGLSFTEGSKTTAAASFTMPSSDVTVAAAYKALTSIAGAKVVLSADSLVYNGKVRKPSIKTIGGMTLTEGTDYTVSWSNGSSKNVGSYTLVITGKGDYMGVTNAAYKIIPKGTSLKRLVREKKAVTVNWKRQSAKMSKSRITGYQIQLATDKKFKKNKKTVTVKGYKKTSKKVKKLKGKKKYYVRIRTYKIVSGTKYYSNWSKTKAVKTR